MSTEPDFIYETAQWKVFLALDQTYLGRSIVTLKRSCGDLADVTPEELADFLTVVKAMEAAMREAFGATMFNWACLMNHHYQNDPPDPQVHWHLLPRYDHQVEFAGLTFVDADFGNHYSRGSDREVGPDVRRSIAAEIQKNLGKA